MKTLNHILCGIGLLGISLCLFRWIGISLGNFPVSDFELDTLRKLVIISVITITVAISSQCHADKEN